MENENQLYVRYGDFILLQVEHLMGSVQSQGFSNRNVYLQINPTRFQELYSRNKRDFVFQIMPRINFEARNDYQQALDFFEKNYGETRDEINEIQENADGKQAGEGEPDQKIEDQLQIYGEEEEEEPVNISVASLLGLGSKKKKGKSLNIGMKKERDNYKKKLAQLERKLKEEEIQNMRYYNSRLGHLVMYGHEIQLLHVDSNCFLQGLKQCASEDNSCNQIELSTFGSKNVYFKTVGGFRYKQDGDRIHYNDQIVLQHLQTGLFLHVTEKLIRVDGLQGHISEQIQYDQSQITPKKIDRRQPPTSFSPMCEVNLSTVRNKFSIIIYRYFDEDPVDMFIKGGSVIRCLHSEKGGYLHSDDKDFTDDGLAEVYLWNFKGKSTDLEASSSSSLFQIELCTGNQQYKDTSKEQNKSEVAPKDQEKPKMNLKDRAGQVFNYSISNALTAEIQKEDDPNQMNYRLRHLNTGRLVIDQEVEIQGIKMRTLGLGPHITMKNLSYFSEKQVEQVSQEMKELESIDAYLLEDMQTDACPKTLAELDQRSRFRIISTNPSLDPRIKSFSCVQLEHVASEMYLAYETRAMFAGVAAARQEVAPVASEEIQNTNQPQLEIQVGEDEKAKREPDEIFYFAVDDDDIQSGARDAVELKQNRSNEDAFFLVPESYEILQNILFIQTAIDLLRKYLPAICSRNFEISKDKQQKVFDMLDRILKFLIGDTAQDDDNQELPKGYSKEEDDLIQTRQQNFKLRQKLMRELFIVEHLVQIIYCPFTSGGEYDILNLKGTDIIVKVCRIVYTLLKLIGSRYYQNELYVSQWINLYFNHAMVTNSTNSLGAEETILVLVDENEKLLNVQITSSIINKFIDLCIKQNRNQKIIQLISAICAVGGHAVQKNQDDITTTMLENDANRAYLMMPLRMRNDGMVEVLLDGSEPIANWKALTYARKFPKKTYGYFLSIIDLVSELCIDRNPKSLRNLQDMYSFDTIKNVIKNESLQPEMRAIFMRVLMNMHMNREPLEPLQVPSQTGVWNECAPFIKEQFLDQKSLNFAVKQSQIPVPASLIPIKKFVENLLHETGGIMSTFELGKNMLVLETLKIVNFMISHGFYANLQELKDISKPMIQLLNGSTDIQYKVDDFEGLDVEEFLRVKRYFMFADEDIIIQSKIVICNSLLTICKLETDGKAQVFLSKFKGDLDKMFLMRQINVQVPGKAQALPETDQEAQQPNDGVFSCFKNFSLGRVNVEKDEKPSGKQENENIEFLQQIAGFYNFEADDQDTYICILFDLLLYREEQISKGAFELLIRLFCRKRTLLENLINIQMLESPKSIQTLNKIKQYHIELRKYIEDADQWLNKSNPRSNKSKQRVTEIFKFFTTICVEKLQQEYEEFVENAIEDKKDTSQLDKSQDQIQASRRENRDRSRVGNRRGAIKPQVTKVNVQDFILFSNQDQITNKENQRLLGSFGIENVAMFFIKYRVDRNQVNDPFYNDLIQECYKFLVVYVKDNFTNQFKVYSNLEIFLRDLDKNPLISLLIYEMFRDNKRFLTLNVSKILRQIIIAAEEASLQSSKKALYLKLLEVFCKFEDKLVRPNQQEIVINFTRDVAKNNLIYLFSTEGLPNFVKLLKDCIPPIKPKKDMTQQFGSRFLKNFVEQSLIRQEQAVMSMEVLNVIICLNLMSLCCEGKSDLAEQKCQTDVCNMPTALQLYECSGKLWPFKCSLIRYVAQVFLDSNNSQLFSPIHNPLNFSVLRQFIELVREDVVKIFEEWNNEFVDMNLLTPDGNISTLCHESKNFAMIYAVSFLKALLKNKKIELGVDLYPSLHDITATFAQMYYETTIEDQRLSALDVLVFINNCERYAHLLENVQHPANQNIYLEAKKSKHGARIVGLETDSGQKTTALSGKLMQLSFSQNMMKQKENEFENLVNWVTNIDLRIQSIMTIKEECFNDQQFNRKSFLNVTYETVLSSCMTLIDSQKLSKDLHILGLTLLRKCIEIGNPVTNAPSADWIREEFQNCRKLIQYKQTTLVNIGMAEFLCKHIQEVEDSEILENIFLVCISLLVGGNRESQDAFYLYLSEKDPTNIIMQKFKVLFIEQFDLTKKVIGEKNAKLAMVYRANQRQEQREALGEIVIEEVIEEAAPDPIGIQIFDLSDIDLDVSEEVVEEEEVSSEDEQLLTIDESDQQDEENEDPNKPVDEMFVIRQAKTLAVLRCMRMLRFLQLLMEGQHIQLQNFLREQVYQNGSSQKTFDFISYVAQMLALYEKQYINSFSCALGAQLIATLVESIQGPNKQNQMKLVESKIIDCIRDLINQGHYSQSELKIRGFITPDKLKYHNSLIQSSVKLLLSIIEGPVDKFVYKQIIDSFDDFLILTKRMQSIYNKFVSEDLGLDPDETNVDQVNSLLVRDSFIGSIIEGFDIYSLLNQLSIVMPIVNDKIGKFMNKDAYLFFKINTGHIEIQKDGEVMTVYFPIQPMTRRLSDVTKENFQRTVERESNQHKIIDLIAHIPEFIDELEHLEGQSHNQIKITPETFQSIRDLSTLIALAINIIIMFLYEYDRTERADGSSDLIATIDPLSDQIITWFGYGQIISSSCLLLGFIINRNNIIVRQGWRSKIEENAEKMKDDVKYILLPLYPQFGELKAKELPLNACRLLLMTEGPYHEAFIEENGNVSFVYFQLELEQKWISLCFLLQDLEFIYFCMYLIFSIEGQIQSRIYYSFHLLDLIKRFPQLQSVIESVTLNGNQLIATAVLGVVVVYIYSCLCFVFVYDSFFRWEINFGLLDRRGESICSSMMHCFLTVLNFGMRAGGGIGDFLVNISYSQIFESLYYFRAFIDETYFIIFTTVLLNVIFGIIIDSFAQLRDLKTEMEEDQKNVCFICNIERQIFERDTEEGFEYHCVNDHDIWQYLNFIIHLKSIDSTELNGTESYILDQFESDDISWFPMEKSQKLIMIKQRKEELRKNQNKDADDDQNHIEKDPMSELEASIECLENSLQQVIKKLS